MRIFITLFIFSIVLFFYLHIQYHLKTSDDLEVYTIVSPTKDKLEEICDIRQPVLFKTELTEVINNCTLTTIDDSYGAFDIKLRNVNERNSKDELYLPIACNDAIKLFQTDKDKKFITENNGDFLQETGIYKHYKYNDTFLRPPMLSGCIYDFYSGSVEANTPLRYNNTFRTFFYITSGKISIKLIPPKYSKYLDVQSDYENGEYYSPINPWNVEQQYKADFGKVKVLDLDLEAGDILFIPAYWFYSIHYVEMSSICVFQYRTYMNTVTVLPDLIMEFLQRQNIQHKIFKAMDNKLIIDS
jgi:hypothetical protein